MNKIYAVTGGIGSGKSLVLTILQEKGYKVFSADKIYNELISNNEFSCEIYNILGLKFNKNIGFERDKVSSIVFNDKEKLKLLNDYSHSKIMEKMISESKKCEGIVFNEVPLLFESGYENLYDGIIIVSRDLDSRIASIIKRDNKTKEEVLSVIKNQYNYDNNLNNSHILITNDGDINSLKEKVEKVISDIEKNV